jgi:hypothetical protein
MIAASMIVEVKENAVLRISILRQAARMRTMGSLLRWKRVIAEKEACRSEQSRLPEGERRRERA